MSALITLATLLLTAIALTLFQYQQISRVMLTTGDELFERLSLQVETQLENIYQPPGQALNLLSLGALTATRTLAQRLPHLSSLAQILTDNPQLNSVYSGWPDGDYLMLRPLDVSENQHRFDAPPEARWMAWHVQNTQGERSVTYLFLDQQLGIMEARMMSDDGFDPRQRPWYQEASKVDGQIVTLPYVFFSTHEFGTTLARRAANGAVLGADLTLSQLSESLHAQRFTPSSQLLIYTGDGTVIAYQNVQRLLHTAQGTSLHLKRFNQLGSTLLATLAMDGYRQERRITRELEGRRWIIQQRRIGIRGTPDTYLAVMVPQDELLTEAHRIRSESVWLSLTICLVLLPILWFAGRFRHRSG
ncbi:MAG: hypothetical protein V7756_08600 [Halopseudomonas sp.]|uniref:PDC sensor domain-containing protein n=1 Tax=Halopseudomonas sp. TaxID=2901191 RepID=UPI00300155D2